MAFKQTKRKGFNFFRSYYDVYNELEKDSDKIAFIDALLDRQFLGIEPTDLKGMARFAWISQVNSIDSQVKGYEDKTGVKLTPTEGGSQGGKNTPTKQVQVQVQEKVQEKVQDSTYPNFENFLNHALEKAVDLNIEIDEVKVKTKFLSWSENGWKTIGDKQRKIKNWKATLTNSLIYCQKEKQTKQNSLNGLDQLSELNDKFRDQFANE